MKTIENVLLPVLVLVLILSFSQAVLAGSVLSYFSGSDLVDVNGNTFNESVMTSRLNLVPVWTTTCLKLLGDLYCNDAFHNIALV